MSNSADPSEKSQAKVRKSGGTGAARAEAEEKRPFFRGFGRKLALGFFILSAYLCLSMALAPVWPAGWGFVVGPGLFLLSSFAWAAWFLPLWGTLAGLLAFFPGFHPRPTFLLASSALPFLVAAGFARISTEPGAFFENHPVFAAVGLSSLYAGFGFLFAVALTTVVFGYIKLSSWMRATGRLSQPIVAKTEKKPRKKLLAGLREKFSLWLADKKAKRSEAEKRLRTAESIAAAPLSFDFPFLPPVDDLTSAKIGLKGAAPAAQTADMTSAAAPGGLHHQLVPTAASAILESAGKVIEFTSVPPQGASSLAPLEEGAKKAIVERILARKKAKPYSLPVDGILNSYPDGQYWIIDDKTRHSAEVLRETLAEFNIEAEVTGIRKGPVITMFEILPAHGVKISKITNLSDNIALRLAASSVRIVAPIPGKHAVGIEVPNERRAIVSLREVIENEAFKTSKMEIPYALGKNISGEVQFSDLTQMPHLLIAGATGSGKSVCVNAIILSILYRRTPEEVKLILIDPKIVELKLYNGIPHLLTPVVTDPKRAFQALQYCICEMERRYTILDKAGVRDIKSYNKRVRERDLAQEKLPYIVVIVDEFADLMATTGKELEATLARLAAMSRAIGIHLVLATQRPSIDVITGLIKANIPSRIAFMVASKFDSRIIIDMVGAEKLLGRGDMLYSGAQDPFPVRMQGAFVSEEEVERAVAYVKTLGEPEYIDDEIFFDEEEENAEPGLFDEGEGDPLFEKALEIVLQQGKASASYIQRRLKIGYNRSARLVELMEEKGIVGPAQGSKPRDIIRNPEIISRPDAGRSPVPGRRDREDPGEL
ncbi:MAG: DNA translocase FtsK [Spirochaetes bacterium]|nr:DNA translocase FtsK [Spirochaetota bacterium]